MNFNQLLCSKYIALQQLFIKTIQILCNQANNYNNY